MYGHHSNSEYLNKNTIEFIQDLTDDYIKKLVEMQESKEKDILL